MKSEMRNASSEKIGILLIEDNPGDTRLIREMLAEARTISFNVVLTIDVREDAAEILNACLCESLGTRNLHGKYS